MSHHDTPPLLQVRDLCKTFPKYGGWFQRQIGQVFAVDHVNFSLKPGETLGIVGESGCGKSTLGRSILRLHEPSSGQVIFKGQDIVPLGKRDMRLLRKEMQIVFQDPYSSLNPRMNIGKILAEPFVIHKMGTAKEISYKVKELLNVVGLGEESAQKYSHEFSGGQRQRIGIARALALRPSLIVADEPVSALDVSIQAQILNLLVELRQKFFLSYIFIAHDLAVVEYISHKVGVMYLGRIVELASSEDLYANPLHPYTKALIEAIPHPKYQAVRKKKMLLKGDVPSPFEPPSGCHFNPRCQFATDVCRQKQPALRNLGPSASKPHWVACHHV